MHVIFLFKTGKWMVPSKYNFYYYGCFSAYKDSMRLCRIVAPRIPYIFPFDISHIERSQE